ncbi:hypothetical protein M0R04_10995 [Candidatus Dojkabacteria bacterium]|jgi:hypothetical protein|nr:hypothetical protein [Candidatus Dojkabacteria bacterium]
MAVLTSTPFDLTADADIIAAPGAGNYLHILGIQFHNNDITTGNNNTVRLKNGSAGSNLYGGATGAIYTPAKGGSFDLLPDCDLEPYWVLSENTALYMDVSAAYRISGVVWHLTSATSTINVQHATFDITSSTAVVSATASQTIKVVGIAMHNNSTTADDTVLVYDGDPDGAGTALYGGATGAVRLINSGGQWVLPLNYANPYFECSTNTALYLKPTGGIRVSGTIFYYKS